MFSRTHLAFTARLTSTLVVCIAFFAGLFVMSSPVSAASPANEAANPSGAEAVRALELQGFLGAQGDAHILGLEPAAGASSVVLTLVYRTADGALIRDGVNFHVLTEDGMHAYLLGAPLTAAAAVQGRVLRADADGTIVQASLDVATPGNYTVIVNNAWVDPVRYMLSVHGGALLDEGGQTLMNVPAESASSSSTELEAPHVQQPQLVSQQPVPVVARTPAQATDVQGSATHSGVASGVLHPQGDRLEFRLQPDATDGEVSVHLNYRVDGGFVSTGVINFWVLTEDGLHRVDQGAFLAELNLTAGKPEAASPGQMTATVRLGATDTYALVVFNESAVPAQFALEVSGANLMAVDGNGNVAGILADGGVAQENPAAVAVAP